MIISNIQAEVYNVKARLENLGSGIAFYSLSKESKTIHYLCGNLIKYETVNNINIIILDSLIGVLSPSKTASMYSEKYLTAFMARDMVQLVTTDKPTYTPYASKYFFSVTQEGMDYISTLESAMNCSLVDKSDKLTNKFIAITYQMPSRGFFIINTCPIEKHSPFIFPSKYLKSMDLLIDTSRYVYELHNGCFTEVMHNDVLPSKMGTVVNIETSNVMPRTRIVYLEV